MRVAVVVMPSIACSGEDWSCVRSVHVNCFVLGMQTSQAQRCSCPSLARRTVTSRSWPVRLRARTAVQPQTAASAAPQAPPAGGCCIRSKVGAIAAAMLLLNPWMPDMQAYAATSATSSLDASSQVSQADAAELYRLTRTPVCTGACCLAGMWQPIRRQLPWFASTEHAFPSCARSV
jgi:hypothetical protein